MKIAALETAEFTDSQYRIMYQFIEAYSTKALVKKLKSWVGTHESEEDFIYGLCESISEIYG